MKNKPLVIKIYDGGKQVATMNVYYENESVKLMILKGLESVGFVGINDPSRLKGDKQFWVRKPMKIKV